jgi:hypothetical protein
MISIDTLGQGSSGSILLILRHVTDAAKALANKACNAVPTITVCLISIVT